MRSILLTLWMFSKESLWGVRISEEGLQDTQALYVELKRKCDLGRAVLGTSPVHEHFEYL